MDAWRGDESVGYVRVGNERVNRRGMGEKERRERRSHEVRRRKRRSFWFLVEEEHFSCPFQINVSFSVILFFFLFF